MSGENNIQRLRNYLNEKSSEIYFEQTPRTQSRIDKMGNRMRKINKKHNPIKKINAPRGKEIIKRILIGDATSIVEVLDGKPRPKQVASKRSKQRKPRTRKSRVVK